MVIFVEVKTRTNTDYAKPEEAVGFRREKPEIRGAELHSRASISGL
jgi:Holliday junction resolvase-like predicted endonuclease